MAKRNLEAAIRQSDHDIAVRFLPFRMRPDVPPEGLDEPPRFYLDEAAVANVQARGKELGIEYPHKCQRVPNTLKAHVLLEWAFELSPAKQIEVAESLFRAYHTAGLDPTDVEVLVSAAVEAGLDPDEARKAVTSKERQRATAQDIQRNARRTNGVPTFFIDGKNIGSGLQASGALLQAFNKA